MDFGTRGRLAFGERFGTPSNVRGHFVYAWNRLADAALFKDEKCEDLLATGIAKALPYFQSPEVLARVAARAAAATVTGPMIVSRCIACHNTGVAPPVPFHDLTKLRAALERPTRSGRNLAEEIHYRTSDMAVLEEQMPPTRRLSHEERRALLDYLFGGAEEDTLP